MNEPRDLCGKCAAMLREGYDLKRVAGGVDHKVACSHCGKRRYGATYAIEKKSKSISMTRRPWAVWPGVPFHFREATKMVPPAPGREGEEGGYGGMVRVRGSSTHA